MKRRTSPLKEFEEYQNWISEWYDAYLEYLSYIRIDEVSNWWEIEEQIFCEWWGLA